VHPRTGRVRWFVTKRNWRAESMSADVFRRSCEAAGLTCRSQELINWIGRRRDADRHHLDGRCIPLTDCISIFTTPDAAERPTSRIANHAFVEEWRQAVWIADLYLKSRLDTGPVPVVNASGQAHSVRRKLSTARAVGQRGGLAAIGALGWRRAIEAATFMQSAAKARVLGQANRWFSRRHLARVGDRLD
jgi:hypothetical protein